MVVAAREKRRHMLEKTWLFPPACLPSYVSSQRLNERYRKEKKTQEKSSLFLPTLDKYTRVMSLSGISHRWGSRKPARALSTSPVVIKLTGAPLGRSSLWRSVALCISCKHTLLAITAEQDAAPPVKKWLGFFTFAVALKTFIQSKGKINVVPSLCQV